MHEVGRGAASVNAKRSALGVVSVGSGNDIARQLRDARQRRFLKTLRAILGWEGIALGCRCSLGEHNFLQLHGLCHVRRDLLLVAPGDPRLRGVGCATRGAVGSRLVGVPTR